MCAFIHELRTRARARNLRGRVTIDTRPVVSVVRGAIYRKVTGYRAKEGSLFRAEARSQSTADVVGDVLDDVTAAERARGDRRAWPFVTLAWAQSVDGSIALEAGRGLLLSSAESLVLTHAVRASHDAILVGIETVLADDPQLSVRHWPGRSPAPVVLDSQLRTPPGARVLGGVGVGRVVRIACTSVADEARVPALAERGAEVLRLPAWANGWVDLVALMDALGAAGVRRLMVEGGARVLTSFLRAGLGDYAAVTVAPRFLGGLAAVGGLGGVRPPRFAHVATHRLADDLVLAGPLEWSAA
jgi:3,4-dihydroxy 2-butanone 4-phosphate synthase/GTP cyclohydrolase II